jgi:MFS family permease
MVGGIVYGSRRRTITPIRYVGMLSLLTALTLPLAAAETVAVLAVLMAVAGLAVAPSGTIAVALLDHVAPAGTATEAMSWTGTAYSGGLAIGTAAAGALVESSSTTIAFLAASACAALAAAIVSARRTTLTPQGT